MLSGYKTYIFAGLAVASAIAGYLVGDLSAGTAFDAIVTAVLGMTLRSGIAAQGRKV